MSKTLTLEIDDASYRLFEAVAKAENRSVAKLVEMAALMKIHEQQFVDEYEMDEILGDEDLLQRLQQGSREARDLQGRFVD